MYASGRSGWADHELSGPRKDLSALFDLIINHVPVPEQISRKNEDFKMLATTLGHDPFVGRILTGRIESGQIKVGATVQALSRVGQKIEQFDTLNDAFDCAISIATQGDTILFSPACASFDQYLNFEERGKHFISLVQEYRKNII